MNVFLSHLRAACVPAMLLLFLAGFVPAPAKTAAVVVVVRADQGDAGALEATITAALRKQRIAVAAGSGLVYASGAIRTLNDTQVAQLAARSGAIAVVVVEVGASKMEVIRGTPLVGLVRRVQWRVVRVDSAEHVQDGRYRMAGFGKTEADAAAELGKQISQTLSPVVGQVLRARWPTQTTQSTDDGYVAVHLNGVKNWAVVANILKHLKKALGRSSVQVRMLGGRGVVALRVRARDSETVAGALSGIKVLRNSARIRVQPGAVYVRWSTRGRDGV